MSAQFIGDTTNQEIGAHLSRQDSRLDRLEMKMDAILSVLKYLLGFLTFIASATIVGVLVHVITR